MTTAATLILGLKIWGGIGALVAAIFLTIGMDRIDEDAREAYVFRPLLIPGVLVLWPLVLWRWYLGEAGREDWRHRYDPPRKAHGIVGFLLPLGICLVLAAGFSVRQTWPAQIAPQQISAPQEQSR